MLRLNEARPAGPSAVIFDSRTQQSTPKDALAHPLAAIVTPAKEQDRAQVGVFAEEVQAASGQSVTLACADQGDTGQDPAKLPKSTALTCRWSSWGKPTAVLLPRRGVIERRLSWSACYKRLARDDERLAASLQQLHDLVAFVGLALAKVAGLTLLPTT